VTALNPPALIKLTEASLALSLLFFWPLRSVAQHPASKADTHIPRACTFLTSNYEVEKDDPQEERSYAASENRFFGLWCTAASSSLENREAAADEMAACWKKLWYRDDPFNAAFHETGSDDLLAMMAITSKVPKPLIADSAFMHDWLEDCRDRCFMIYGEDESGEDRLHLVSLRNEALDHLKKDSAAKPILEMLKTATIR